MAVTKIRKISSWTLLISSIISIIVLGMFYAGGVSIVLRDNHQYNVVCRLAIFDVVEDKR